MPSELIQNTRKRGRAPRTKAPKLRELAGRRHVTGLLKLRRKLRRAHAHPNRVRHYDDVLTVLHEADFVLRIKTSQKFMPREDRPLTPPDHAAAVLSDRIGTLPGGPQNPTPAAVLREVVIADLKNTGHVIRLLTNRTDLPAHLVGEVYRHRWQIELFFRWLKVHAQFRHLISHSKNGITLGFYVAVIGTLLMYLHTGRKVSKYAFGMLTLVAGGDATLNDILPILERRERERDLARQRLARIKAAQKNAV